MSQEACFDRAKFGGSSHSTSCLFRVNESSSGNKIVFEPPHAHEPGVDPHLHNTVYENAAFGRLHVLAPDTGVASLPDSVGEVIGQMTQARQYGSAYSGKKDLVAIFEAKQNHLSYYALYRTGPGKYWAQHHCIKRAEAQDDGELIDATRTVRLACSVGPYAC